MKSKLKKQNGITLVALIITVIILLILAVVAIRAVQGDGIIAYAKNARDAQQETQDKEAILLALNEWKIVSETSDKTLESFMKEKFGTDKVTANGDELTVILENGNQYKVKEDGTIISTKGISLSKTSLALELKEGQTVTEEITATLSGITGEITWSIANEDVVKMNSMKGKTVIVTAVAEGSTTITVRCGNYTDTCTVTVKYPLANDVLEIDLDAEVKSPYVQYNGILCRVLYDKTSNYGLQLVTANTVKNIAIGDSDPNIAIEKWNGAIDYLNQCTQDYLDKDGIAVEARCFGTDPLNPTDTFQYIETEQFGRVKESNALSYKTDWEQLAKLEIKIGGWPSIWTASRVRINHFKMPTLYVRI